MDEKVLEIVLRARDEASKTIQEVGKQTSGLSDILSGSFKNAAIISGVALAGVTAEAFKAVGAFSEAEAANRQLEHAVIGVSHATKEQLIQTEALADALEAKGVLDGDNIKIGLAQLSTFGLTNKQVQGLSGSLADLAVNQFGVNASGDQLSQTANMIAKALNGQFGVLEKSGIRFTEAQRHMIQYGSEMERVKAINEGFAQNLKYTNEVAAGTTEGSLAKMNVAIENIHESIGKLIANAIQPLIPHITAVANIFANLASGEYELEEIQLNLTEHMGAFGTVLGQVIGFLTTHHDAVIAIAGAIGGILSIGIIAATVAMVSFIGLSLPVLGLFAAIGAGVALVVIHWKQLEATAKQITTSVSGFFANLGKTVSGVVNGIISDIRNMVNSVIDSINRLIHGVNGVGSKIGLGSAKVPDIPKFENGGYVPQTGIAMLHQGEYVLSNDMLAGRHPALAPANNYNQPINIYATVANDVDLNYLAYKLGQELRNR